jgi:hypothetical protein
MKKIVILSVAAAVVFFAGRVCGVIGSATEVITRVDTVVVRDTVRETIPMPIAQLTTRIDTVWLKAAADSVRVEVPIERKIYQTADYRAEVEGFRASLVSLDIYRQTRFVNTTRTVTPPRSRRLGFGIQAGYGITPHGPAPYIGVGLQFRFTK